MAKLHHSLGLTPMEFAAKLRISVGKLRHWERGDRKPHGPALTLLHVGAKEPGAVSRALGWIIKLHNKKAAFVSGCFYWVGLVDRWNTEPNPRPLSGADSNALALRAWIR